MNQSVPAAITLAPANAPHRIIGAAPAYIGRKLRRSDVHDDAGRDLLFVLTLATLAAAQSAPAGSYVSGADLETQLTMQDAATVVVARVENTELTRINLSHHTIP